MTDISPDSVDISVDTTNLGMAALGHGKEKVVVVCGEAQGWKTRPTALLRQGSIITSTHHHLLKSLIRRNSCFIH
jgi:hypothetical protein